MDSTSQRFGEFEFNVRARELRKDGIPVKLQDQPFQILAMLLERPGEIVERPDIQKRLWPGETLIDVDLSLNSAVRKLRQVLGDDPANPRFIQTLHGRGYRFVALVNDRQPETASASNTPSPGPTVESVVQRASRQHSRRNLFLTIAAAIALLAVTAVVLVRSSASDPPRITNFAQITSDGRTKTFEGRLLTDGARVYLQELREGRYVIAQAAVGGGETSVLDMPFPGAEIDDVATDGSALLVRALEQTGSESSVWRLPLPSGAPVPLGNFLAHSVAWSSSTGRVVFSQGHALFVTGSDGANPRKLVDLDGTVEDIRFSPRGDRLRFTLLRNGSSSVWQVNSDGTGLQSLFPRSQSDWQDCCGNWTPDGRYFVFQRLQNGRSDLWAVGDRLRWFEDAMPTELTNGPLDFSRPVPSRDGDRIFAIGVKRRAELVRYDPKAGFTPYLGGISAEGLTFSSDGQWVAYASDPDGILWRSKVDGSERVQLTHTPMRAAMPRWAPGGDRIVFMGRLPNSNWHPYLINAIGAELRELIPGGHAGWDPVWSADGRAVFVSLREPFREGGGISKLDLATGNLSEVPGSANFFSQRCSPDGRFMVGVTTDSRKLMLYTLRSGQWSELVSPLENTLLAFPNWSHDGKYVYFDRVLVGDPALYRVRVSDRKLEKLVSLADVRRFAGDMWQWSGLAPDDSPLLVRDAGTQEIYALDWQAP